MSKRNKIFAKLERVVKKLEIENNPEKKEKLRLKSLRLYGKLESLDQEDKIEKLLKEIIDELRKSNEPVRFIDESHITELNENRERARSLKEKSLKLLKDFDNLLIEARKN